MPTLNVHKYLTSLLSSNCLQGINYKYGQFWKKTPKKQAANRAQYVPIFYSFFKTYSPASSLQTDRRIHPNPLSLVSKACGNTILRSCQDLQNLLMKIVRRTLKIAALQIKTMKLTFLMSRIKNDLSIG